MVKKHTRPACFISSIEKSGEVDRVTFLCKASNRGNQWSSVTMLSFDGWLRQLLSRINEMWIFSKWLDTPAWNSIILIHCFDESDSNQLPKADRSKQESYLPSYHVCPGMQWIPIKTTENWTEYSSCSDNQQVVVGKNESVHTEQESRSVKGSIGIIVAEFKRGATGSEIKHFDFTRKLKNNRDSTG